ncbi:MAG: hypothetical protein KGL43_11800 [Burkholderiales bacterium]|nr:hypothetical protein [Burkholderiales bacterium]
MRSLVVSMALLVALAACSKPETPEQRDAYDNLWCADQGIYRGDARYAECRRRAATLRGHQYNMGNSVTDYTPSPAQDGQGQQACSGGYFECEKYLK